MKILPVYTYNTKHNQIQTFGKDDEKKKPFITNDKAKGSLSDWRVWAATAAIIGSAGVASSTNPTAEMNDVSNIVSGINYYDIDSSVTHKKTYDVGENKTRTEVESDFGKIVQTTERENSMLVSRGTFYPNDETMPQRINFTLKSYENNTFEKLTFNFDDKSYVLKDDINGELKVFDKDGNDVYDKTLLKIILHSLMVLSAVGGFSGLLIGKVFDDMVKSDKQGNSAAVLFPALIAVSSMLSSCEPKVNHMEEVTSLIGTRNNIMKKGETVIGSKTPDGEVLYKISNNSGTIYYMDYAEKDGTIIKGLMKPVDIELPKEIGFEIKFDESGEMTTATFNLPDEKREYIIRQLSNGKVGITDGKDFVRVIDTEKLEQFQGKEVNTAEILENLDLETLLAMTGSEVQNYLLGAVFLSFAILVGLKCKDKDFCEKMRDIFELNDPSEKNKKN